MLSVEDHAAGLQPLGCNQLRFFGGHKYYRVGRDFMSEQNACRHVQGICRRFLAPMTPRLRDHPRPTV